MFRDDSMLVNGGEVEYGSDTRPCSTCSMPAAGPGLISSEGQRGDELALPHAESFPGRHVSQRPSLTQMPSNDSEWIKDITIVGGRNTRIGWTFF